MQPNTNDLMQALLAQALSVPQAQPLVQGLQQAQGEQDAAYQQLAPLQDAASHYNTSRMRGGLFPIIGEAIFDAFQKHRKEPKRQEALVRAMAAQRGVDEKQAQVAAFMQQMEQMKAQSEQQAQAYQKAAMLQQTGMNPAEAQARGFGYGSDLPQQQKPTSLIQNMQAAGIDPQSPQGQKLVRDYLTKAQVQVNPPPSYRDFIDPKTGATITHTMNPDGTMGPEVGMSKAAPPDPAQEQKTANMKSFEVYKIGMDNVAKSLGNTITAPGMDWIPALTESAQISDSAVAAMAPVLKQLFRVAGEGIFTDKDQALLLKMLPNRSTLPGARAAAIKNVDNIVKAKLGLSEDTSNAAQTSSQPQNEQMPQGTEGMILLDNQTGQKLKFTNGQWVPQ